MRGLMGAQGVGAAAIYIFSYGQNTIGNRLYCFLGLRSKMCEWSGVDTPKTVMTTRAPAMLKTKEILKTAAVC